MTQYQNAAGPDRDYKRTSALAVLALLVAVLAGLAQLGGAIAYRQGYVDLGMGFLEATKVATYGAAAAVVLGLMALGSVLPGGTRKGFVTALLGIIIGGALFYNIFQGWMTARTVPFIHDITTDMTNPPKFVAVLASREEEGANPHDYAGPELAAAQRCGYPDLAPLDLPLPRDEAFAEALAVAETMEWDIVDSDPVAGRIEATQTSFVYGFKDDIVIRVKASGAGSRIDMRSLSRTGQSDLGVNAARIGAYLAALSPVEPE